MVANIKDFTDQEAVALKEAGFVAVYHTVRLREGLDKGGKAIQCCIQQGNETNAHCRLSAL